MTVDQEIAERYQELPGNNNFYPEPVTALRSAASRRAKKVDA
jgi:hypothetical protein